jgi:hypothetical protein
MQVKNLTQEFLAGFNNMKRGWKKEPQPLEIFLVRGLGLESRSGSQWSPTGIARGTFLHARVGRHPGQTLAHSSTGKARGLLLPGEKDEGQILETNDITC